MLRVSQGEGENKITVAVYQYDGMGYRTAKLVWDGEEEYFNRTDYYYDNRWQVVEERTGVDDSEGQTTVAEAFWAWYVWDVLRLDRPICTYRTPEWSGPEVVFYLTDANGNVTTLMTTYGWTAERYAYDAYGTRTVLDGVFDPDGSGEWGADPDQVGDWGNEIGYGGYRLDPETGLWYSRRRYYNSTTGTWAGRDPTGYADGPNLYAYCAGDPIGATDPMGCDMWEVLGRIAMAASPAGRVLNDLGVNTDRQAAESIGELIDVIEVAATSAAGPVMAQEAIVSRRPSTGEEIDAFRARGLTEADAINKTLANRLPGLDVGPTLAMLIDHKGKRGWNYGQDVSSLEYWWGFAYAALWFAPLPLAKAARPAGENSLRASARVGLSLDERINLRGAMEASAEPWKTPGQSKLATNMCASGGAQGVLTRVGRFFYDSRSFSSVSREYWGGAAGGRALHHWLIPQRTAWIPQGIRNAGFNLLELPSLRGVFHPTLSINTWIGFAPRWGGIRAAQAFLVENSIRLAIPASIGGGIYVGYEFGSWVDRNANGNR